MSEASPSTRLKRSRAILAQRVLASFATAAGEEISAVEELTRKRTENPLRQGLRNRWFAPAEEFARLQIARLEHMILKLLARIQKRRPRGDRPRAEDRRPARPPSRIHEGEACP